MSAIRKLAASRFFIFILAMLLLESQASATTILSGMPFTFVNGQVSDATQVNANFSQIVTQVNAGAAASGSNNDITALNALATPITQIQGGNVVYLGGTSTGSANAQAIAVTTPTGWTLAPGKRVVFPAGFTNTNATTLAVNAGTATAVLKTSAAGLVALTGNEIIAGNTVEATYDGTEFVLLNQNLTTSAQTWVQAQAFSKAVTLSKSIAEAKGAAVASAATADIWTPADGNLIHITGTTTITSLGTAHQAGEERTVIFDGILTLTYNATTLQLPGAANITTAAGDRMIVRADTTANMIVVDYVKASGQPVGSVSTNTATTSGTAILFSSIPANVRRITLCFNGVSTNGTNSVMVQLGAGSITNTGYLGSNTSSATSSLGATTLSAAFQFALTAGALDTAAAVRHGILTFVNVTGNTWAASGTIGLSNAAGGAFIGGTLALGGVLDRVNITTVGGTDTFDAGSISLLYEF